jgi:anhydro-N-acetylmuramic acid kinase
MSNEILILGLIAGTSVDGIDAAVIKSDGNTITHTGHALTTSYENATRDAIFDAYKNPFHHGDNLDDDLAERIARDHARAAEMLIAESGLTPDLIGFHGQTIHHDPEKGVSLQIGDAGYLADRLGRPVIHQFRQNDMANGGQGAPLAPVYHQALMQSMALPAPAAIVNIGGISNASVIDDDKLIGFDLGPGNALMDDLAQSHWGKPYDDKGAFAEQGRADESLVQKTLTHDFFQVRGPKSLDRMGLYDLISADQLSHLAPEDRMATLLSITAEGIIHGIKLNAPDIKTVVCCGGGCLNPALMKTLYLNAESITITRMEDHVLEGNSLDSRYIEAEMIGYLAARSYYDLPITFPGTTGVDTPRSGGVKVKSKVK